MLPQVPQGFAINLLDLYHVTGDFLDSVSGWKRAAVVAILGDEDFRSTSSFQDSDAETGVTELGVC